MPLKRVTSELVERIIDDVQGLKCLKLTHNALESVDHLHKLHSIVKLDLSHNCLALDDEASIRCLAALPQLRELNLMENRVGSLACFGRVPAASGAARARAAQACEQPLSRSRSATFFPALEVLDLRNNLVSSATELAHLRALRVLDHLWVGGNPVCAAGSSAIARSLPLLRFLDGARMPEPEPELEPAPKTEPEPVLDTELVPAPELVSGPEQGAEPAAPFERDHESEPEPERNHKARECDQHISAPARAPKPKHARAPAKAAGAGNRATTGAVRDGDLKLLRHFALQASSCTEGSPDNEAQPAAGFSCDQEQSGSGQKREGRNRDHEQGSSASASGNSCEQQLATARRQILALERLVRLQDGEIERFACQAAVTGTPARISARGHAGSAAVGTDAREGAEADVGADVVDVPAATRVAADRLVAARWRRRVLALLLQRGAAEEAAQAAAQHGSRRDMDAALTIARGQREVAAARARAEAAHARATAAEASATAAKSRAAQAEADAAFAQRALTELEATNRAEARALAKAISALNSPDCNPLVPAVGGDWQNTITPADGNTVNAASAQACSHVLMTAVARFRSHESRVSTATRKLRAVSLALASQRSSMAAERAELRADKRAWLEASMRWREHDVTAGSPRAGADTGTLCSSAEPLPPTMWRGLLPQPPPCAMEELQRVFVQLSGGDQPLSHGCVVCTDLLDAVRTDRVLREAWASVVDSGKCSSLAALELVLGASASSSLDWAGVIELFDSGASAAAHSDKGHGVEGIAISDVELASLPPSKLRQELRRALGSLAAAQLRLRSADANRATRAAEVQQQWGSLITCTAQRCRRAQEAAASHGAARGEAEKRAADACSAQARAESAVEAARAEASAALSQLQHDAEVRITEQERSNAALQHEGQQLLRELARVRAAAEGSTRAETDSLRERLTVSEAELSAVRRERNTLLKAVREHTRTRESSPWNRENTQREEVRREEAQPEEAQPEETRRAQARAPPAQTKTRQSGMNREKQQDAVRSRVADDDDESANVALRAKLSALSARSASLLQNRN